MMLLSALLGPAKAPVATEEDVESAGGLYVISAQNVGVEPTFDDASKTAALVAVAVGNEDDRAELERGQRCLVCLCDFEIKEITRKLVQCQHLYHKECIDQVSISVKFPWRSPDANESAVANSGSKLLPALSRTGCR